MNYYWYTPEGKIVQAAFDAKPGDVESSPLSGQYQVLASELRVPRVSDAYVGALGLAAKPGQPSRHHQWDYHSKAWVDPRTPEQVLEQAWADVRKQRDKLLKESDWVTHRAIEQGTTVPTEWVIYRQALRDVTGFSSPDAVVWPVKP